MPLYYFTDLFYQLKQFFFPYFPCSCYTNIAHTHHFVFVDLVILPGKMISRPHRIYNVNCSQDILVVVLTRAQACDSHVLLFFTCGREKRGDQSRGEGSGVEVREEDRTQEEDGRSGGKLRVRRGEVGRKPVKGGRRREDGKGGDWDRRRENRVDQRREERVLEKGEKEERKGNGHTSSVLVLTHTWTRN